MIFEVSLHPTHQLKESYVDKNYSFSVKCHVFDTFTTIMVEISKSSDFGYRFFSVVNTMNNIYWNLIVHTEEFVSWK